MKHVKKINEFLYGGLWPGEDDPKAQNPRSNSNARMNDEEQIETEWHLEFDGKEPTKTEKMEWYHKMRTKGFDGILIFDVVGHLM